MNPEVEGAVAELRASFPSADVTAEADGNGGAFVEVNPVDPGPSYVQRETWLRFLIGHQYPYADVYPLYVRSDLARVDGNGHGEGIAFNDFRGERSLQLSRRSNHRSAEFDTATRKVHKVLEWLRAQ